MAQQIASSGSETLIAGQAEANSDFSPALSIFTKIHVCSVAFLIFMGALVKSHEAGLAVPDWPTTFGQNMFLYPPEEWIGGIFYEHTHRLVASVVGFLTVILALCCWRKEKRRWVKNLSYLALALVIIQGLLGGLTVIMLLPPIVSIAHGVIAQTFFVLSIIIAYVTSREFNSRYNSSEYTIWKISGGMKSCLIFLGLVYLQLILGALMRHSGAALAVPDFPTMGGTVWPILNEEFLSIINEMRLEIGLRPVNLSQVLAHLAHRGGAVLVTIGAILLFLRLRSHPVKLVTDTSRRLLIVLLLQWALGMYTIWMTRDPYVASFHVVVGAILLGISTITTLRVWRFSSDPA